MKSPPEAGGKAGQAHVSRRWMRPGCALAAKTSQELAWTLEGSRSPSLCSLRAGGAAAETLRATGLLFWAPAPVVQRRHSCVSCNSKAPCPTGGAAAGILGSFRRCLWGAFLLHLT